MKDLCKRSKTIFFQKTYKKQYLLDNKETIQKRISIINALDYKKYNSLVKTEITEDKESFYYKQKYIYKIKRNSFKKDDFFDLVDTLEYFSKIGFIHGDLNRRNIIFTKDGFKIIDLEPSLRQLKNLKPQYMLTIPYISKLDLATNEITINTDKIAFFYFVLRVQGYLSSLSVVKLSKTLQHNIFFKMSEKQFVRLSYKEILEKAWFFYCF